MNTLANGYSAYTSPAEVSRDALSQEHFGDVGTSLSLSVSVSYSLSVSWTVSWSA